MPRIFYLPFLPIPVFDGFRFVSWASGICLGPIILIHRKRRFDECLLVHELTHYQQWRRDGFAFYLRYLGQALTKGYYQIDYEVEAFAAQRRFIRGEVSLDDLQKYPHGG
jgi:hypothetical protein